MNKVIKLDLEEVVIAKEDGTTIRVPYVEIDFKPELGDFVELYPDGEKIIVHKVEPKKSSIEDKIQINIVNEQVQKTQQAQTQQQEQFQQMPPSYNQNGKSVNKLVYVLLAIFLGSLGAHKFYSGKMLQGFIYLIFFWTYIPGIISFIEGVIAAFKKPDEFGNIFI
ncbi:TM2 domain-containing protein [Carnobacterium maltaromaticum]|uniref:TM2 domain-containing protein n=1 Tax=Carnobacterium maltaromaticum TaxID=2751 RepID=UPI0039BE8D53